MQTLYRAPRVHQAIHSHDAKKDSNSSKNQTTPGLQWKGMPAVTTRQLQVEAKHRMASVATAGKKKK